MSSSRALALRTQKSTGLTGAGSDVCEGGSDEKRADCPSPQCHLGTAASEYIPGMFCGMENRVCVRAAWLGIKLGGRPG